MKRILIIEDDRRLALALSVRLKAHGYATWIAGDCIDAVSTAVHIKPDLILLDITVPAGDGFTLIEKFEHFPETRETPIIFATASKDPDLRKKALGLGASGLLRKPYDPDELLGVVQQVLERWGGPAQKDLLVLEDASTKPDPSIPKRVLIIEDDERVALALAIRMEAAGFDTTVANDAVCGVRHAVNNRPDVVVLDISLPAGDGFAVAERIQAHVPDPIRIIFLTASKRPDFRQRAEQLGAVGFFEKPYEAQALLTAVQQAAG